MEKNTNLIQLKISLLVIFYKHITRYLDRAHLVVV